MNFTTEQDQAIHLTNQNILVSAGAGAGKTRVLVERIAEMLLREENPVSADELLVLTFTNLAAAEMKERIEKEMDQRLKEDPSNQRIRKQRRLMKTAQVSTVHSFCGHLIRTHFEQLGLDPSYRIGEEGELVLLQKEVMEQTLEEAYRESSKDFFDFVEAYVPDKNDSRLENIILKTYEFSKGFPDSGEWYASMERESQAMMTKEGLEASQAMHFLIKKAKDSIKAVRDQFNQLEAGLSDYAPGPFYSAVEEDEAFLNQLENQKTYQGFFDTFASKEIASFPRKAKKNGSEHPMFDPAKGCHDALDDCVKQLRKDIFFGSEDDLLEECKRVGEYTRVIIRLSARYEELYGEKKQEKNVYDFNDLEHFALKLLVDHYDEQGEPVPTETARELGQKYKEIFVDEYQDTNLVQETLLKVLWNRGENHLFMVGDVKQSIYRFRLARPDLFMHRYNSSRNLADEITDCGITALPKEQDYRIELRDNFRSSPDVLNTCNFMFKRLMSQEFGGIDYNDSVALRAGEGGPMCQHREKSELMLYLDGEEQSEKEESFTNLEKETAMIAKRMKELREEGYSYGDMVILLRSTSTYAEPMMEFLRQHDIPAVCESQTGYFQTREISLMMNYLAVVDNVYQDIPMASVLLSSFGQLTEEELALLKTRVSIPDRPKYTLYDLMLLYIEEGENVSLIGKLRQFLEQLAQFRKEKMEVPIGQLIWDIYLKTGFYYDVQLMPEGEKRKENLLMLLSRAEDYEQTVYKGLFYFIRYMEQLRSYEVELSMARDKDDEKDVVRILTIHKSKGLEFPVVFVSNLSKQFNTMDLKSSVLYHPELGIGIDDVDLSVREKKASFIKNAIKGMLQKELLEEELRVLYVAMTRAQNRLILTGTYSEKKLKEPAKIRAKMENPLQALSMMDWVVGALTDQEDFQKLLISRGISAFCQPEKGEGDSLSVKACHYEEIAPLLETSPEEKEFCSYEQFLESLPTPSSLEPIQKSFERVYDYEEDVHYKRKYSVSELKKMKMEENPDQIPDSLPVVEMMPEPADSEANVRKVPHFLMDDEEEKLAPTMRGTIVHKVMELLPMGQLGEYVELDEALEKIKEEYPLCKDINMKRMKREIEQFLEAPEGKKFCQMDREGHFYREVPFTAGIPVQLVYPESQSKEMIVIQGVIDAYGETEDGIWLLDYKTDRVKEAKPLLDHYASQMLYYKTALEQILHKKVIGIYLYSFTLHQFVPVELTIHD